MNTSVRQKCRNGAVSAVAALAVALFVAACGGSGSTATSGDESGQKASSEEPVQQGGTLRLADTSEAISLDPTSAIDNPSIRALSQIIEPLFKTNAEGEVEPWLVTDVERSSDGRTWTLQLRDGVEFSNGKPMTAEDVVWSLDNVRKSGNWSSFYESITKVSVKSPSAVTIETKVPVASLEADLSLFAAGVVPKNYGGVSPKEFGQDPVGTGPFQFASWARGQALTLERNPRYWQSDRPILDEVVFEAVPDDNSRTSQLRGGELDLINQPPWSQLAGLEQTPGLGVGVFDLGYTDWLVLNLRTGLLADERAREAVNIGIDRESIVKAALAGYGEPGLSWFMPPLKFYDDSIKPPQRDAAKAKQLLAEAVEDTGEDPSMTLFIFSGDSYYNTVAQVVQENLEEIGLKVNLQPLDESAVISRLVEGKFDAALIYFSSDIVDPSEAAGLYLGLEGAFTGADTTEVAKLAEEGVSELDEEKRRQLYYEMQEVILDQRAALTFAYRPFVWAMSEQVVGFDLNTTGIPWLADAGLSG